MLGYILYAMDSAAKIMGGIWIAVSIIYFVLLTLLLKKPVILDL